MRVEKELFAAAKALEGAARVIDPENSVSDYSLPFKEMDRLDLALRRYEVSDRGRDPMNESVAESLLRELFEGKVDVALAGNPITCERLEKRIQAFFEWKKT